MNPAIRTVLLTSALGAVPAAGCAAPGADGEPELDQVAHYAYRTGCRDWSPTYLHPVARMRSEISHGDGFGYSRGDVSLFAVGFCPDSYNGLENLSNVTYAIRVVLQKFNEGTHQWQYCNRRQATFGEPDRPSGTGPMASQKFSYTWQSGQICGPGNYRTVTRTTFLTPDGRWAPWISLESDPHVLPVQ